VKPRASLQLDRGYDKPRFDSKVALEIPIHDGSDRDNGGQVNQH
jgi:hypothetical protein